MSKRNTVSLALVGLGLLGLTACGDKDKTAPEGAASALAEAPKTAAPATPKLKAGLWRVTNAGDGAPQGVSRMCLDDAVQARMSVFGAQAAGACQPTETTANPGGGWRYRTVCDQSALGGGTSVAEGVMTGDLATAYASRTTVTTTGAQVAHMNGVVTITGEGAYEGPCPADMKPGDMVIPGGMKFNMVEMAAAAARMTPKPAG